MRLVRLLALTFIFGITQLTLAQGNGANKSRALIFAIGLVEGWAFGTGALSTLENGPEVVAITDGLAGAAVLVVPVVLSLSFKDISYRETTPEFNLPHGLGLLGLGYYNLVYAPHQTPTERFWKNVIGYKQ